MKRLPPRLLKAISAVLVLGTYGGIMPAYSAEPGSAITNPERYQETGKIEAIDFAHDVISINDRGYVIPIGTTVHGSRGNVSRNALHVGNRVGFNSMATDAGLTVTEIWILSGR